MVAISLCIHVFPSSILRYFEKRLNATEESYKEEIALLQLKLVEGALEESVLKTTYEGYVINLHMTQTLSSVMLLKWFWSLFQ